MPHFVYFMFQPYPAAHITSLTSHDSFRSSIEILHQGAFTYLLISVLLEVHTVPQSLKLEQYFSKCVPNSAAFASWENLLPTPRPHESETLGWDSALCVLISLPRDSEAHSTLTTSALE